MENQNPNSSEPLSSKNSSEIAKASIEISKQGNEGANLSPQPLPSYYNSYVTRTKAPEYIAFKKSVTSTKGLVITLLSILLCIMFTETILFGATGISMPIFIISFYAVIFYSFRETGKPINKTNIYLSIPILLLSFSFFIHYNPSTQFVTLLTLFALLCIQLVLVGNIPTAGIFTFDMFCKIFINLVGKPFGNLIMPFHSFEILKVSKSKTSKNIIYILTGIIISFPVVIILMSLFISADAVFADAINKLYESIGLDFAIIPWKIIFGTMLGLFLAAILLCLKYSQHNQKNFTFTGNNIESAIMGTFLTLTNISIIAFVAFQFIYLFGGTANVTASGMSYSTYARRGFFELSAASFLIFAIALFVLFFTKKNPKKLPLWIQLSTVCICLCNGVLLISSMKRMLLYVDVYGLSIKRVLTIWFMLIIGVCLFGLIIKCFIDKVNVIKWISISLIVGVCILSLTNTERIIAKYNVDRYLSSPSENSIDINYLSQLSYTAVPEIVRLNDLSKVNATKFDIFDINKILEIQKSKFENKNNFYGFTLDYIQAEKILYSSTR